MKQQDSKYNSTTSLTFGWLNKFLDEFGVEIQTDSMTSTYSVYGGHFSLRIWTHDMSKFCIGDLDIDNQNFYDIWYGPWTDFTKENLNKVLSSKNLEPIG